MVAYQDQKQEILHLFDSCLALAHTHAKQDIQQRLAEAKERLTKEKLFVVVCGEFKQGKSTLINALLNEPGLFPVDVDITTTIVSSITYGEQEKIVVVLEDPGKEEVRQIGRAEIPDYVTEQRNRGNYQKAQMLVIESPNERLREGLVLVDTPGVGGLNTQHTAISYAFIPNADAILFVSDALAPLSSKELDFVRLIARHCRDIIFVLTKIDAVSAYREVLENNRSKLAQVLGRPGNEIPIIPVSSSTKLAYLQSRDDEDLEDSNYAALESALWSLLGERRGSILLMHAAGDLRLALADLSKPLQVEWETYQKQSQQEKEELKAEFEKAKIRLQDLLHRNANWQAQLNHGLEDIKNQLQYKLRNGFVDIGRQLNADLDDPHMLGSPGEITSKVEVETYALIADLGKELSRQAASLQAKLKSATGLGLKLYQGDLDDPYLKKPSTIGTRVKKTGWFDKAMSATQRAVFATTAGAFLGGLLGGITGAIGGFFVAGPVGAVAGAKLGADIGGCMGGVRGLTSGVRQALDQVQEKDQANARREISRIVGPYKDECFQLCRMALDKGVMSMQSFMREDLTQQINQEIKMCKENIDIVEKARNVSRERAAQKSKELENQLRPIDQLERHVDRLAEAIAEQDTRGGGIGEESSADE